MPALYLPHSDARQQFVDAIRNSGLNPPEQIVGDGNLHRFSSSGKRGDDSGWYVMHEDGVPAGAFGDWRTGLNSAWRADIGRRLTPEELSEHRRRRDDAEQQRTAAEVAERERAKKRAAGIWATAKPVDMHPYLKRKGVKSYGLRADAQDRLLIPLRDHSGELQSLESVSAEGEKRFLPGGRVTGLYHSFGKPAGTICIAEGYATGASIHEATGHAVAIAMNAGNLEAVARALRSKYPDVTIILCADDDAGTEGNPGLSKARNAALAVNGLVAVPDFGGNRPAKATDFNDLAQHRGAEAVKACIAAARKPEPEDWPEPMPLVGASEPKPFPLDALPDAIGDAVREQVGFVQCPVPLAAQSVLSALSLAGQALVNVRRGSGLEGPVSLYLLTLAESGERKSECDRRFSASLREWESEQLTMLEPDLAKYRADVGAWEQEVEAVKQNIKQLRRNGESTEQARMELEQLELNKPKPVRAPRLLLESETAENLAWTLGKPGGWPSAGLLSSEAGVIFGGHSMKRDSVMQSLSLLNKLWSGESLRVGRRTSESFEVDGARLTMGLAAQPETVQAFFDNSDGLARTTGFFARFLISRPETTQGTRFYREPPETWPALTRFQNRIRKLLETPFTVDDRGRLAPATLDLAPDAFEAWRKFHDDVERQLKPGGELSELRDVGSKAPENAARMAALFHLFEHGPHGSISLACLVSAARIVTWYLSEARRFLGDMALPRTVINAVKLEAWLVETCRDSGVDTVKAREAMRRGPNPVRHRNDLAAALAEIMGAGRVRLEDDGRTIRVHPALLRG